MIKEYFVVGVIATAMMAGTALAQTPVPAVRQTQRDRLGSGLQRSVAGL